MSSLFLPEPKKLVEGNKTGILLLNLGSPKAPKTKALRPYLNQFLSDKRVVELSSWKWQPILKGIILPFRSPKSAKKYQKIWQTNGSPLLVYTQQQAEKLQSKFDSNHIIVDFAMTYGQPDIESVTQKMKEQGVSSLIVLPLFPQYAGSSTGAALDALFRVLSKQRNMLDIHTITRFYQHPAYIQAICQSVQQHWKKNGRAEHLLMSFHGVPLNSIEQGDPYFDECHSSAKLIANKLDLESSDYTVSFQSRFGKAKWVEPSTQNILITLPQKNNQSLDVICPGFVADCLETLEEIAIEGQKSFINAGGKQFNYIPCLNTQESWIEALYEIISTDSPIKNK